MEGIKKVHVGNRLSRSGSCLQKGARKSSASKWGNSTLRNRQDKPLAELCTHT